MNVHCSQQQHFENEVAIRTKTTKVLLNRPSPVNERLHLLSVEAQIWKTTHSIVICYMYLATNREILQQHT
jgi:hypothetical protein